MRSGLVCDRLEPLEAAELYGKGEVADSLPQKYLGLSNVCPMREHPAGFPFLNNNTPIRLIREKQLRNPGYSEWIEDSRYYSEYE